MRTIIEIPDEQLQALKQIELRDAVSRAHVVRQAIAEYVVKRAPTDAAFGAWATQTPADSLDIERALRDEWVR